MVIHLVVPTHLVQGKISVYRRIIDTVHAEGFSLARNWIEPAFHNPGRVVDEERKKEIVEQLEDSINRSDALIAEASNHASFGVGYQVARALERNKPVLVLADSADAGVMLGGIVRQGYVYKQYSGYELESHTQSFLKGLI